MQESSSSFWEGIIAPPLRRNPKPRQTGLTMVIDKGLGLNEFADLLLLCHEHIDFIKLAFGTSLLYPPQILERKIRMAKEHQVAIYPGGTLLEIAVVQKNAPRAIQKLAAAGFTAIEISDGTINLPSEARLRLMRLAAAEGLQVISEVGKKDKAKQPTAEEIRAGILHDLEGGAEYVIVEGRDSGKGIGVFSSEGEVDLTMVKAIVSGLPHPEKLIWEAPQVAQQQKFLIELGLDVNLGNVQTGDVLSLAATRMGLRGDTLRLYVEKSGPVEFDNW
ncbi:MAG TPA: phosphosulfolactate synthase [Firmicutes bacterium]|nr:phosphosulfolactate synthase [Bacillota bacterium]